MHCDINRKSYQYIIIIVQQQITGRLEVSIISYVRLFVTELLKTTSSLEKHAIHINEHPKNILG